MARIGKNNLTSELSGKLGGQLVFQKNGVVRSLPDPSRLKWSEAQKQQRKRFEQAKNFARNVIVDPDLKQLYQVRAKKGTGAYHVAISEYMRNPNITCNPSMITGSDS